MAIVQLAVGATFPRGKRNGTVYQQSAYGDVIGSAGTAGYIATKPQRRIRNIMTVVSRAWTPLTEEQKESWHPDNTQTIDFYHVFMERNFGMLLSHQPLAPTLNDVTPFRVLGTTYIPETNEMECQFLFADNITPVSIAISQTKYDYGWPHLPFHYSRFIHLPGPLTSSTNYFLPISATAKDACFPQPAQGFRSRFRFDLLVETPAPFIYTQHMIIQAGV